MTWTLYFVLSALFAVSTLTLFIYTYIRKVRTGESEKVDDDAHTAGGMIVLTLFSILIGLSWIVIVPMIAMWKLSSIIALKIADSTHPRNTSKGTHTDNTPTTTTS